jgi:hypothetical protein
VEVDTMDANQPRDGAYLALLHRGLVMIRNHAHAGHLDLCRIEADHLHNIPTLLAETNEHRHVCYIEGERGQYLERLRELGATEYLERVSIWYSEPWRVLAAAAGVQLSD